VKGWQRNRKAKWRVVKKTDCVNAQILRGWWTDRHCRTVIFKILSYMLFSLF
jgi:hypothetical protein